MPVDTKVLATEIKAAANRVSTTIRELEAEVAALKAKEADLEARVGNVPDEDAATIRSALADLNALVIPPPVVPNVQAAK